MPHMQNTASVPVAVHETQGDANYVVLQLIMRRRIGSGRLDAFAIPSPPTNADLLTK